MWWLRAVRQLVPGACCRVRSCGADMRACLLRIDAVRVLAAWSGLSCGPSVLPAGDHIIKLAEPTMQRSG